jgi:hypothetical protein
VSDDILIELELLWDRRSRLFPAGAVCGCGEARAFLFVAGSRPFRCYGCDRTLHGLDTWEDHHLGGQGSPFEPVPIPANLHRILSDLQAVGWRGCHTSGSEFAVSFDIAALFVMGSFWFQHNKEVIR